MSCQDGVCQCGFLNKSLRGRCNEDEDCDCRLSARLVAIAVIGGLLALGLILWGLYEEALAKSEKRQILQLMKRLDEVTRRSPS